MNLADHQARIKRELSAAGMTTYGQLKMGSRYLPSILAEGEHIGGVVYGRCPNGLAMLVATDKRIIYLERRPFFSSTDDIDYSVVSGVRRTHAVFSSVDMHTKIGNYNLRFVNPVCANKFVDYIERKIEHIEFKASVIEEDETTPRIMRIQPDVKRFINDHEIAVLSTADRTGDVYGAAVYYLFENGKFFILTKTDTSKAHNILGHHQVALTIFDDQTMRTAQVSGYAMIESDMEIKLRIFNRLTRPHKYSGELQLPPVTDLVNGGFIAFVMIPTHLNYTDYLQDNRALQSRPISITN